MSISVLNQVYDEVRRLMIAGSDLGANDFRLKKLVPPLRKSAAKAPVFGKVADNIEKVLGSTSKSSAQSLLDLGSVLFGNEGHDMLAGTHSARTGLDDAHTTLLTGIDGVHTYMQKNWRVEALVERLLSEPLDASDPKSLFSAYVPPGPGVTATRLPIFKAAMSMAMSRTSIMPHLPAISMTR